MNCYGGKELAESFRTVRKNTIQVAQDIPEAQYGHRLFAEGRTVAELLAHIAGTIEWPYRFHAVKRLSSYEGIDFASAVREAIAEEKKPRSKDQLLELLRTSGEKWAGFLDGVTDEFLAERVQMPPGAPQASKSRFEIILAAKEHEMHHRGQLMLIERQLGIVPHLTRELQARFAAAGIKL